MAHRPPAGSASESANWEQCWRLVGSLSPLLCAHANSAVVFIAERAQVRSLACGKCTTAATFGGASVLARASKLCAHCRKVISLLDHFHTSRIDETSLSNSNPRLWATVPWEIAKLYMKTLSPIPREEHTPGQATLSLLLSFFVHCTVFALGVRSALRDLHDAYKSIWAHRLVRSVHSDDLKRFRVLCIRARRALADHSLTRPASSSSSSSNPSATARDKNAPVSSISTVSSYTSQFNPLVPAPSDTSLDMGAPPDDTTSLASLSSSRLKNITCTIDIKTAAMDAWVSEMNRFHAHQMAMLRAFDEFFTSLQSLVIAARHDVSQAQANARSRRTASISNNNSTTRVSSHSSPPASPSIASSHETLFLEQSTTSSLAADAAAPSTTSSSSSTTSSSAAPPLIRRKLAAKVSHVHEQVACLSLEVSRSIDSSMEALPPSTTHGDDDDDDDDGDDGDDRGGRATAETNHTSSTSLPPALPSMSSLTPEEEDLLIAQQLLQQLVSDLRTVRTGLRSIWRTARDIEIALHRVERSIPYEVLSESSLFSSLGSVHRSTSDDSGMADGSRRRNVESSASNLRKSVTSSCGVHFFTDAADAAPIPACLESLVEESFVGRESLLDSLVDLIDLSPAARVASSPRLLSLYGPSGVGKSTLAARIAIDLRNEHDTQVFWINAASTELVEQDLRAIAITLQPALEPLIRTLRLDALFPFVNERLFSVRRNWVVVVDDLSSGVLLRSLVPHQASLSNDGLVIVTTHSLEPTRFYPSPLATLAVPTMNASDSTTLMRLKSGRQLELAQLAVLTTSHMRGHPLVISIAGAVLRARARLNIPELLRRMPSFVPDSPAVPFSRLLAIVIQSAMLTHASYELLGVITAFGSSATAHGVPIEWIECADDPTFPIRLAQPVHQSLDQLLGMGIVNLDASGSRLHVHSLVVDYVDSNDDRLLATSSSSLASSDDIEAARRGRSEHRCVVPLRIAVEIVLHMWQFMPEERNRAAAFPPTMRRFVDEAVLMVDELCTRLIALHSSVHNPVSRTLSPYDARSLVLIERLAAYYLESAHNKPRALDLLDTLAHLLTIYGTNMGRQDHRNSRSGSDSVDDLSSLTGASAGATGGAVYSGDSSDEDNHVLFLAGRVYAGLGTLLYDLGHYDEAKDAFDDALNVALPVDERATVLYRMGRVFLRRHKLQQAIDWFKLSMSSRRRVSSGGAAQNLMLAATLFSYGQGCMDMGNFSEAMSALERSLAMRRRMLGPTHVDVARTMHSLGDVYYLMSREEAKTAKARAAACSDNNDNKDDQEEAVQSTTVERVEVDETDASTASGAVRETPLLAAINMYSATAQMYRRTVGEGVLLARVLNNQAVAFVSEGKYAEALSVHQSALEMKERCGVASEAGSMVSVANTLHNMGNCLIDMERPAEAFDTLARALMLRRRALGESHEQIQLTLASMRLVVDNGTITSTEEPTESDPMAERRKLYREALVAYHAAAVNV